MKKGIITIPIFIILFCYVSCGRSASLNETELRSSLSSPSSVTYSHDFIDESLSSGQLIDENSSPKQSNKEKTT